MDVKIKRSDLPENFEADVEKYRQALLAHRFTINKAAPVAPTELIHNAIKRVQHPIKAKKPDDFEINYVILENSLEERKQMATAQVLQAEQVLAHKIMPPGKHRLWHVQVNDIQHAVNESRVAFKGDPKDWVDPTSTADKKFLAAHQNRLKRLDELHRIVAQALSDIDDLTSQSIVSWQMPVELREVSAPAET